ncbi:MAG: two-component sensor histidine kinase, partial [Chitinophagaceae bacterium]
LLYIIAALVWWFFSLEKQNKEIYSLRKEIVLNNNSPNNSIDYTTALKEIQDKRKRNLSKYIGEGSIFLLLIIAGGVFIYQSVKRQFRLQQQQQNFVMAITHELKTPISVSKLNLETLLKYHLEEAQQKKLLQMNLQETVRLDGLINNILISSQLEGGGYNTAKEELDFSDLVIASINEFKNRYPERPIESSIEEETCIDGDATLLKLLVNNLLENANKYSPKEKLIQCILAHSNNIITLQVTDEGVGINEEEKKRVFEKFYRVGNEQTRKTKGTGLGLYICKRIVESLNGNISIADNQPTGTKFIVTLPRA